MKKYILLLIMALITLAADAQTAEPNRMIVFNKQGRFKAWNINDIDSVGFFRTEGRVAADVKVNKFAKGQAGQSDTLWIEAIKTEACRTFKITVIPTNTANTLTTDLIAATFIEENGGIGPFTDDFPNGQMTGFETPFKSGTSYTVMTVGYDGYGTACEASKAEFTVPQVPLIGNPDVAYTFTDITPTSFKCKFTPNEDVAAYAICQFNKGEAQQQFEMWGPMMGFDNMGDMIKQFSQVSFDGEYETEWKNLKPNTDYEVAIQAWDANGTYAPIIYAYVTTASQGGPGEAKVDITIGEFGQEGGEYYQWIKFTPNDQTFVYHLVVAENKEEDTSAQDQEIENYLKNEKNPNYPPMFDDPNWDVIGEDNDRWALEPNKTYTAYAIAMNANKEWGPFTKVKFTTPDVANAPSTAKAKKADKHATRFGKKIDTGQMMTAPKIMLPAKKTGMRLINK